MLGQRGGGPVAQSYDGEWQLTTLLEDVARWNLWRKEHPEIKIDLPGSSLEMAKVRQADLSETNLSREHVLHVILSQADQGDIDLYEFSLL
jgi:hypothetical protein